MDKNLIHDKGSSDSSSKNWLPTWFKVCVFVVVVLVVLKTLRFQVFVEVSYDGIPFIASLTEIETYFIPLGLLLLYILSAWIWDKIFGSKGR